VTISLAVNDHAANQGLCAEEADVHGIITSLIAKHRSDTYVADHAAKALCAIESIQLPGGVPGN
jgi:hypothetical protein